MTEALPRYAGAAGLAALVTFSLFFLMQAMIASGSFGVKDSKKLRVIDFVRLRRSEEVQEKQRQLPQRQAPERPPPPQVDLSDIPKPDPGALSMAATAFQPEIDLARAAPGAAASDADAIPLVRVNPQYPSRALIAGIEGWVHLEFTVTAAGTVKDVKVLDADPRGYFEKAAEQAVLRYRYKPKIENGSAVERPGVQIILSFKLNK